MNRGAERHARERQAVAELRFCVRSGLNHVANREAVREEHVALLSIHVVEKSDACGAVWVVLHRCHARWDAELVAAEVDLAIKTLLLATTVTHSDLPLVVATGTAHHLLGERLVRGVSRDLLERWHGHPADAGAGWLKSSKCHD